VQTPPRPPWEKILKKENPVKSGFNGSLLLISTVTTFEHAITTMRITKTFCNFEIFWNYKNNDNYKIRAGNEIETFEITKYQLRLQ
jgi:hypothetical protein